MFADKQQVTELVAVQLKNIFATNANIESFQDTVMKRVEGCFINCGNKYYSKDNDFVFSPFHSVQYSIYLYYLANTIFREKGSNDLSTKIYCLNKVMNCVDWYYEISLPDIFCAEHPIGSVMGRATYSNKFFFYQGCTVGGSNGKYPVLGENLIMYSNTTILGNSLVGSNVVLSSGTLIVNEEIPENSIVFGRSPNLTIKQKSEEEILKLTSRFWK